MTKRSFLIIRGAPGVGKSAVATLLRHEFPNGLCIEVDTLRMMVNSNSWDDVPLHLRAIKATGILARFYADQGHAPIVLVDTFSFGSLNVLLSHFDTRHIRTYSLVASDEILTARVRERVGHGFVDWERSIVLNANIRADRQMDDELVDTTNLTPSQVVERIMMIEHRAA